MHKITPFLWFDDQAEEAAHFYVSLFKNSKVGQVSRGPKGVMTIAFEVDGQPFIALNGGPTYKFTEAVSFSVCCEDQAEVDALWDKLCEDGQPGRCAWLKDKFGVSWQIVPKALPELLADPDREKSQRVMQAMLQMSKIDVAKLREAHAG